MTKNGDELYHYNYGGLYIYSSDELYHYGVPGMKWGERKAQAKLAYKEAKRNFRAVKKANKIGLGIGAKGLQKRDESREARKKAKMDVINAKAELAGAKKKDLLKSQKAEVNSYAKALRKAGGENGGREADTIRDAMIAKKGKDYAYSVMAKVKRERIKNNIGNAANQLLLELNKNRR